MLTVHPGGRDILRKRGERRENGYSMTICQTTACTLQYYGGLGTLYSLLLLLLLRIQFAILSPSIQISLMKKGVINSRFAEYFFAELTRGISSISKEHRLANYCLSSTWLDTACPIATINFDLVGKAESEVGYPGCQ